ncbi:ribitol-5-phosphate transferase FKTN-like [Panonychus citri]|uniref:ribitol-5-phosphate transferase FKTN-like n=1 Tax=Panonychus citri TaxID=50023 RepID=UPI002306E08D|nr:ribitol-5-phosphate transferase FKTN-like [Panonychus citri]
MIKSHLICVIIITSVFLLLVQLIVLQSIVTKNQIEVNHIWESLHGITSLSDSHDVPLFLIDGKLCKKIFDLQFSSSGSLSSPFSSTSPHQIDSKYCQILCNNQDVTHLGTLGEFIDHRKITKLVQSLKENGYTVLQFIDLDPTLLHHDLKVTIPMHLIVFKEGAKKRKGHVVHVAVLYERLNQYWWSSPFSPTDYEKRLMLRQGARKADFVNSDHAVIYKKVEISNTVIDGLTIGLPKHLLTFHQSAKEIAYIECNKTQAKKFHSAHGSKMGSVEQIDSFRSQVKSLLSIVKSVLDDLGIPFWLSSGTALGWFRQCDVIAYSRDVDIGIWISDYRPEMIDHFYMNNLPLLHAFGKVEDSYELSFRHGNVKLDVFFFYTEADHVWNGGTQAKTGYKFKYIFPKFNLCWTEFLDLLVRVPCDTKIYIEANYGSNWSVPVEKWDWKSSPPNVNPNGRWPLDEWSKVIQLTPTADSI